MEKKIYLAPEAELVVFYSKEDIANLVSIAGLVLALILVVDMVLQLFETIIALFDL